TLVEHAAVRAAFAERLKTLAAEAQTGSTRICRLLLMATPPSMDLGEMTDKGSINQRAVLKNRAALVDELYATPLSSRVISIEGAYCMDIKGHAAIATGGAPGLGAATARALAAAGGKVALLDINEKAAGEVAQEIGGISVACDVGDGKKGALAVKRAADKHGAARILVNCAGIGPAKR